MTSTLITNGILAWLVIAELGRSLSLLRNRLLDQHQQGAICRSQIDALRQQQDGELRNLARMAKTSLFREARQPTGSRAAEPLRLTRLDGDLVDRWDDAS